MPRKPPPGAPWVPPQWEIADAGAIQALARGEASPDQQKRAFDFVIRRIAGTYDLSFQPGSEDGRRATDFAEGRRFVGLQLVKLVAVNLARLRQAKTGVPEEQA